MNNLEKNKLAIGPDGLFDQECRLFKSLANRRLIELGETFDEYKLRLKINAKMLKQHKRESSRSNI